MKLTKNYRLVLEILKHKSLNRLEVASLLHSGVAEFSEWYRPSKYHFGRAAQLMDALALKGLIEPAGDSEKIWKKKYKLTEYGTSISP